MHIHKWHDMMEENFICLGPMRGLEKNRMVRGHSTHGHVDSLTNSAQRAELVKMSLCMSVSINVCSQAEFLKSAILQSHKRTKYFTIGANFGLNERKNENLVLFLQCFSWVTCFCVIFNACFCTKFSIRAFWLRKQFCETKLTHILNWGKFI